MLRIANFEEIQDILLRVPGLITRLKQRQASFSQEAVAWLELLEQALVNNRMQAAGKVAALRAILLTAEHGAMPANIIIQGQPTRRKIREAVAADAIRGACELVLNTIKEEEVRLSQARQLCRQVVVLGKSKDKIPVKPEGLDHLQYLRAVWKILSGDPDIAPGAVQLEGLVGSYDILVLLDRTMTAELT